MEIIFVVAISENRAIGKNGALLWHLPNDLKRFRALTLGHHILMGRKTFNSIGRALPERTNLVLTKDPAFFAPDIEIVHSMAEVLSLNLEQLMVIGGEEIYRMFLPYCHKIYLTLVHAHIEGDAHFPELLGFVETKREFHDKDDRHPFPYTFIEYSKTK